MEQYRLVDILGVPQNFGQKGQVVAVHRAQVAEPHIFKHTARQQGLLQGLLDLMGHPIHCPAWGGGVHDAAVVLFKGEVLGFQSLFG